QVTVDHSVVQELMDRGELTSDEARVHPYRHMVTRALGAGPEDDPDYWLIPAETGDRMLVWSDGLTGEVEDASIERALRSPRDVRTLRGPGPARPRRRRPGQRERGRRGGGRGGGARRDLGRDPRERPEPARGVRGRRGHPAPA